MSVKLLTEHHLEFLSLKGGCTGWSESTLVKIPHCWKSPATDVFKSAHTEVLNLWALLTEISNCNHRMMDRNIPESGII